MAIVDGGILVVGERHAPVLVDLLGISIDTANQWSKHAGSDWVTYLGARVRSQR